MSRKLVTVALLFSVLLSSAQTQLSTSEWMISFTDKAHNTYELAKPEMYLSSRSIERRQKYSIAQTDTDLPVSVYYIDSLKRLGFTVQKVSKWLNAVSIRLSSESDLNKLSSVSFVVHSSTYVSSKKSSVVNKDKADLESISNIDLSQNDRSIYGAGYAQIAIHNGQDLHNKGFRGQNILIALLDDGFLNANSIIAFDTLRNDKRIVLTRDIVSPNANVYLSGGHGTSVLSTIGCITRGVLTGTAPKASFALIRTENDTSEYPIEEFDWAIGAELADSIGADVISSSLGYSEFDLSKLSYSYSGMNGKTAISSQAATIASAKGMIVVISAGNSGAESWKYITAPADADHILAVGAVDSLGSYASFSSQGPSYDGRVKPDVCAVGSKTVVATTTNKRYAYSNGTSFSAPIMAGLSACLWQAFPAKSNTEIMAAIRKSSSIYANPTVKLGYGIPDFALAYQILAGNVNNKEAHCSEFSCYPNPFTSSLYLHNIPSGDKIVVLRVLDNSGRLVKQLTVPYDEKIELTGLENIPTGIYFVVLSTSGGEYHCKAIKI